MGAVMRLPERHPGSTIALAGVLCACAYLAGASALRKPDGRLIVGDAVHYYVYVRSAVFDRDLDFRNEYVRLYGLHGGEPETEWVYQDTATGHVRNLMPVGPAIVWTPLFLIAAAATWAARAAGATVESDGYSLAFQASAALSGIMAASLGAWLTYRWLARLFDRRIAIWSTLTVWGASSALYYSLVSPAYSHAASMLASGLFFFVWGSEVGDPRLSRFVGIGLCAGLAALVRWQDAVLLVAPAVEIAWMTAARRAEWSMGRAATRLAATAGAAVAAFVPQMIVWQILYGTPFTVPQGGDFMKWTAPALMNVLVSDWHGLFSWTPIAAVAAVGLFLPPDSTRRPLMLAALGVFVASWYVNAAVADWWAGEAFGARRFVSCFPIFALGVAAVGRRLWRRPALACAIACAFVISNLLLLVQYQMFMHGRRAPYPSGWYGMTVERFVVLVRLAAQWWRG